MNAGEDENARRRKLVGAAIRAARKGADITQDELAAVVGVHRQSIVKYESGETEVGTSRLGQIAEALGVAPHDLLESVPGAMADIQIGMIEGMAHQRKPPPGRPNVVREPNPPAPQFAQELLVRAREFELESARRGADEAELDYIHRALSDPAAYVRYAGGAHRAMTPDEMRTEQEDLIIALTAWLDIKLRRRAEAKRRGGATGED